jgi:hypothetical protein
MSLLSNELIIQLLSEEARCANGAAAYCYGDSPPLSRTHFCAQSAFSYSPPLGTNSMHKYSNSMSEQQGDNGLGMILAIQAKEQELCRSEFFRLLHLAMTRYMRSLS